MSSVGGDNISASVSGNVSGQVAVGKHIAQTQSVAPVAELTEEERAELQQLFVDLRSQVAYSVPEAEAAPALERIDEFEEALTAEEPDLSTVQYVKRWFVKRLPTLAGLVTGVLVNPIVGKLVQSAGDAAMSELQRVAEE